MVNVDNPAKSFYTISPTCTSGGGLCEAPLDGQTVNVTKNGDGSFGVDFTLTNSITRSPSIDGSVSLNRNSDGSWTSHGKRDAFPSMGIYQSKGGQQSTIWQSREHSPVDLTGINRLTW